MSEHKSNKDKLSFKTQEQFHLIAKDDRNGTGSTPMSTEELIVSLKDYASSQHQHSPINLGENQPLNVNVNKKTIGSASGKRINTTTTTNSQAAPKVDQEPTRIANFGNVATANKGVTANLNLTEQVWKRDNRNSSLSPYLYYYNMTKRQMHLDALMAD